MFELSKYQKDVLDCVKNESTNLLIEAKAGSGKTSTLLLISEELKKQNNKCLFLAFNKTIVDELSLKLTDTNYCSVRTLHSTGYSFILSYLYKLYGKDNFKIDSKDKYTRNIIKDVFETKCQENVRKANLDLNADEFKNLSRDIMSELFTIINIS